MSNATPPIEEREILTQRTPPVSPRTVSYQRDKSGYLIWPPTTPDDIRSLQRRHTSPDTPFKPRKKTIIYKRKINRSKKRLEMRHIVFQLEELIESLNALESSSEEEEEEEEKEKSSPIVELSQPFSSLPYNIPVNLRYLERSGYSCCYQHEC